MKSAIFAAVLSCLCLLTSSASAQWSVNGVKIFYTSGQVGIGTNSPQYTLDVRSAGSRAISGFATAGSGASYGVYGQSNSSSGRGVLGLANSSSGTNYGIYGRTRSNNGYAGYFLGGRNYFQGNVGIGTSDPKSPLHVATNSGKYAAQIHNAASNGRGLLIRGGANDSSSSLLRVETSSGAQRLEVTADGVTKVKTITILGGADLAEPFNVAAPTDIDPNHIQPGMVVSIDPNHAGRLTLSTTAYDGKVAGVISGANDLAPGMVMKAEGDVHADGDHPVALTGRVWCWCDATIETGSGAIQPGDRLTTSLTPGHAMKVGDESRAPGTVIGKAMTRLESGRGLVLVLVNLQ